MTTLSSFLLRPALVLGLAAPLLLPAAAPAARFGAPVIVSGKDDATDATVAIAPNGRTAVLYRKWRGPRDRRDSIRVAIGRDPEHTGTARTLAVGARTAAGYDFRPQLLARPDGGFIACFPDNSKRRPRVTGCSIASPTGGFGPLIPFGGGAETPMSVVVRPDSSAVVLIQRSSSDRDGSNVRTTTSVVTISAEGQASAERPVPRAQEEYVSGYSSAIAVTSDGTVAIPAAIPVPGTQYGRRPGLRLMAPGSDTFGPIVPVSTDQYTSSITLRGGRELLVSYDAATGGEDDPGTPVVVRRLSDGSFAAPQGFSSAVKTPDPGGLGVTSALLPSGDLIGATSAFSTREGDADCFDQVAGQVRVGPLGAPGSPQPTTRLSTRGQIALHAQIATLDDGTAIAAWENAAGLNGSMRIEVAVRAPGAASFGRPQVMPQLAADDWTHQIITSGNHAALLWTSSSRGKFRATLSTLRTTGPYAKFARLPSHPKANCDE